MGHSSTHEPLSEDLGRRGPKRLKGISAGEAIRFARLLHRNRIFQCFKEGKRGRKEQLENLSSVVMHVEKFFLFNSLYHNILFPQYFMQNFKCNIICLLFNGNCSFSFSEQNHTNLHVLMALWK